MKTPRSWHAMFLGALCWTLTGALYSSYVDEDVTMDQFHQALDNYGQWVEAGQYGQAWHPTEVAEDWAPYTDGQWVYTDDGWTWMGAEAWSDPVSHYGRWTFVDGVGWCWVPGYDWAPAWVSWRDADDYVGWAPLPPEADWNPDVGLGIWVDSAYGIGPGYYHFARKRHFGERNIKGALMPARQNLAFMLATANVTHSYLNKSDGRVYVGGPSIDSVSQAATSAVPQYHVVSDAAAKHSSVVGNDLHVAAPAVKSSAAGAPASVAKSPALARSHPAGGTYTRHSAAAASHGWSGVDAGTVGTFEHLVAAQSRGLTPQTAPVRPHRAESAGAIVSQRAGGGGGTPAGVTSFQRPTAQLVVPEPNYAPAPVVRPGAESYGRMYSLPQASVPSAPPVTRVPAAPSFVPSAPIYHPTPSLVPEHRVESGANRAQQSRIPAH